jgi:hypothetical protein
MAKDNTHCPKLNMNEKKTSKFQFNFPTLLGPCLMLKRSSKNNNYFVDELGKLMRKKRLRSLEN